MKWKPGIGIIEDEIIQKQLDLGAHAVGDRRSSLRETNKKRCDRRDSRRDRRRATRVYIDVPVRYRIKKGSGKWKTAQGQDLSQVGIRVATWGESVSVGDWMELDLKLPKIEKTFRLEGRVVWIKPSKQAKSMLECGLAFEDLKRLSRKESLISFLADRFCRFAIERPDHLVCRPPESFEELEEAYRLLYQEYLARRYCEQNPSRMYYTYFSVLPETRTFILKSEKQLYGTISLMIDSPCGLPMESIFPDEIARLRKPGRRLAEVSLLALSGETFGKGRFSLTYFRKLAASFRLFKMMFDCARFGAGVTDLVIAMHPKHAELYRYLKFNAIGPVRSYKGVCGKPALPMHMDISQAVATVPTDHGRGLYFLTKKTPRKAFEKNGILTRETVRLLLFERRALWQKIPPRSKRYLLTCYPNLDKNRQPPDDAVKSDHRNQAA